MPWTASDMSDIDAVLTVYSGVITPAELQQAAARTVQLAGELKTVRLLGDCMALEGGHSIVDLYGLSRMLESLAIDGVREALVMPRLSAAAQDVHFWETTCRNRGIDVRVFRTLEEARAWLGPAAAPAEA